MAESSNDGIGDNEACIRREEHWDHVNGRARRSTSTYDEAMQFNLNPRNEGRRAVESEFIPPPPWLPKGTDKLCRLQQVLGRSVHSATQPCLFFEQLQKATPR